MEDLHGNIRVVSSWPHRLREALAVAAMMAVVLTYLLGALAAALVAARLVGELWGGPYAVTGWGHYAIALVFVSVFGICCLSAKQALRWSCPHD